MRLNRGTLSLGLISVIVIVAALLLSQQEANNPASGTPTATSAAVTGPLFPDIAAVDAQSKIVRFEVVNTTDQSKVVMTKECRQRVDGRGSHQQSRIGDRPDQSRRDDEQFGIARSG